MLFGPEQNPPFVRSSTFLRVKMCTRSEKREELHMLGRQIAVLNVYEARRHRARFGHSGCI